MRFSYYNSDKDEFSRKYSSLKKTKLFTIHFNYILEHIQFENSDRGLLLWVITPKTVRVFGYWRPIGVGGSRKFYRKWTNEHCDCF